MYDDRIYKFVNTYVNSQQPVIRKKECKNLTIYKFRLFTTLILNRFELVSLACRR